jgi:hypothetical protein
MSARLGQNNINLHSGDEVGESLLRRDYTGFSRHPEHLFSAFLLALSTEYGSIKNLP